MNKHTQDEIEALMAVKDGADVYSRAIAKTLRSIERKHPGLVDICEPMMYQGDGTDRVPYFGAICTEKGRRVIAKATKDTQ